MTAAEALRTTRIDRLDAEVLLAHLLGIPRLTMLLNPDRVIDAAAFEALVARRTAHEPVAYIIGTREFWSLDLAVNPGVLIPRPDSETLIEAAIAHFGDRAPGNILDLGTGSGALLLAALDVWPSAHGVGLDTSEAALTTARANAERLNSHARIEHGSWAGTGDRFDLILCNPPYVAADAPLGPGVSEYEPEEALFAGAEGLDAYRVLGPQLPRLLGDGGLAAVEIGFDQGEAVPALLARDGLAASLAHDLAARPRGVLLRWA